MDSESILYFVLMCLATFFLIGLTTAKANSTWIAGSAFLLLLASASISTALAVQMGLTCIITAGAMATGSNIGSQRYALVLIPLIVPLAIIVLPLLDKEYYEVMAVKRAYPIVSLEPRLRHETTVAATELTGAERAEISDQVWNEVAKTRGFIRTFNLRRAHHLTRSHFVEAAGLGKGRMPGVSKKSIDLPELPSIPYEAPPPLVLPAYRANGSVADSGDVVRPSQSLHPYDLKRMHRRGVEDFTELGRMGYVKDLQHVAGFTSHRFTQTPGRERPERGHWDRNFDKSENNTPARESWRSSWAIVRLELIGILRHKEPIAYVSDHLPQMDELDGYRTRKLTDFENSALDQMRSNEDVVIDDQPHRVIMVGALRATNQCRLCHHVNHGDLLGALTYELRPER